MFVCIGPNVMVRIRRVTGRCDRKGSAREMKSSLSGCQSPSLVPSIRIVLRRAHGVPGNVVRATALFTQSNRTANTEGRLQGTRKTGDGTARRSRLSPPAVARWHEAIGDPTTTVAGCWLGRFTRFDIILTTISI